MHIYGKEQQAYHLHRTAGEKWFSRLNMIVVAAQMACFMTSIIRTSIVSSNSMSNAFFVSSPLQLNPAYLVPNCYYNVTRSHGAFSNVNYQLSAANVEYFVSRGVLNLRYLFAVTGVHCSISVINRIFFESNTHELRYHFVVFHKDMLTVFEICLMIIGLVMTFGVNEENSIMQQYLIFCNPQKIFSNTFYNSVQPYIELYVSYFISAGVMLINMLVALGNLLQPNPRDEMVKEDQRRMEEMRAAFAATQSANDSHGRPPSTAMPPLPQAAYGNASFSPQQRQQPQLQQQPTLPSTQYESIVPMFYDASVLDGAVRPSSEDIVWTSPATRQAGEYSSGTASHDGTSAGVRYTPTHTQSALPSQGHEKAFRENHSSLPATVALAAPIVPTAMIPGSSHHDTSTSAHEEDHRSARTSRTMAGEGGPAAHSSLANSSANDTVYHERLSHADEDVNVSNAFQPTPQSFADPSAQAQADRHDAEPVIETNQKNA